MDDDYEACLSSRRRHFRQLRERANQLQSTPSPSHPSERAQLLALLEARFAPSQTIISPSPSDSPSPLLKLPLELIELICEEHPPMILSLRHTSRQLNKRTENQFVKHWFTEIAVVPEVDSMSELLKISQMPRFRTGVKSLCFSTISHTIMDANDDMDEEQWLFIRAGDFRRMLARILKNLPNCTTILFKPTDSFLARSLFEDPPHWDPHQSGANVKIGIVLFSILRAIKTSGSQIKEIRVDDTIRTYFMGGSIWEAQKTSHGRLHKCSDLTAASVQSLKVTIVHDTHETSPGHRALHICDSGRKEDHALNTFFAHLPNLTRLHLTIETVRSGNPDWIPNVFGRHLVDITLHLSCVCLPESLTIYPGAPEVRTHDGWRLLVACLRRSPMLQRLCLENFYAPTLDYVQTVLGRIVTISSLQFLELTEAKVERHSLCLEEGCSNSTEDEAKCRDWVTKDVKRDVEGWRV